MVYSQSRRLCFLFAPLFLFAAADQPWQSKPIAQWSDDDAHQVLSDSPWAKAVTPEVARAEERSSRGRRGGIGQMGGSGVGIGMPGTIGMGRRGGMGMPPATGQTQEPGNGSITPPQLTVRWESALPVQGAELKSRSVNAPTMDDDHYAIVVSGVPSRMLPADAETLSDPLKSEAVIKRDGKKDLKPSSVSVLPGDDYTAIVYFFPRSNEISRKDKLSFNAQILRLKFSQSFTPDEMVYQGKLEL